MEDYLNIFRLDDDLKLFLRLYILILIRSSLNQFNVRKQQFLLKAVLNLGRRLQNLLVGRRPQFFLTGVEVSLSSPTNARKQVNSNSCYFTTISVGVGGGRVGVGGWRNWK